MSPKFKVDPRVPKYGPLIGNLDKHIWLFLQIRGPSCGCPCFLEPPIWVYIIVPLVFGNSHFDTVITSHHITIAIRAHILDPSEVSGGPTQLEVHLQ